MGCGSIGGEAGQAPGLSHGEKLGQSAGRQCGAVAGRLGRWECVGGGACHGGSVAHPCLGVAQVLPVQQEVQSAPPVGSGQPLKYAAGVRW